MKTGKSILSPLLLFVAGLVIGWATSAAEPLPSVSAQDRREQPPKAFLSGGERSAEILKQISKQITTMDNRLARIETAVAGRNGEKSK